MTGEVRHLIRSERDRIARARLSTCRVEFCQNCGSPCDRVGRVSIVRCGECRATTTHVRTGKWHA